MKNNLLVLAMLTQEAFIPGLGSLRSFIFGGLIAAPIKTFLAIVLFFLLFGTSPEFYELVAYSCTITPLILLSTDFSSFARYKVASQFFFLAVSICFLQFFLPTLGGPLTYLFHNNFIAYNSIFSRASLFSMEPSFAAESIFPIIFYLFISPRPKSQSYKYLLAFSSLFLLLAVRAGTFLQQVLVLFAVYVVVSSLRFLGSRLSLFRIVLILGSFALFTALVLPSQINLFFQEASLNLLLYEGSWRSISAVASFFGSSWFGLCDSCENISSLRFGILSGLEAFDILPSTAVNALSSWIVTPFTLSAILTLAIGILPSIFYFFFLFYQISRKLDFQYLSNIMIAFFISLTLNSFFFAPKWQCFGFLIVSFMLEDIRSYKAVRSQF